jgi:hypothetical protein
VSIATHDANSRPTWFTSSYSNGAGGECVECALMEDRVRVRDSKKAEGVEIAVHSEAWFAFICAVRRNAED